jgi:hypothetical protein
MEAIKPPNGTKRNFLHFLPQKILQIKIFSKYITVKKLSKSEFVIVKLKSKVGKYVSFLIEKRKIFCRVKSLQMSNVFLLGQNVQIFFGFLKFFLHNNWCRPHSHTILGCILSSSIAKSCLSRQRKRTGCFLCLKWTKRIQNIKTSFLNPF